MIATAAELRRVLEILSAYRDAPLNRATIDLALRLARLTRMEAPYRDHHIMFDHAHHNVNNLHAR